MNGFSVNEQKNSNSLLLLNAKGGIISFLKDNL